MKSLCVCIKNKAQIWEGNFLKRIHPINILLFWEFSVKNGVIFSIARWMSCLGYVLHIVRINSYVRLFWRNTAMLRSTWRPETHCNWLQSKNFQFMNLLQSRNFSIYWITDPSFEESRIGLYSYLVNSDFANNTFQSCSNMVPSARKIIP